MRATLMVIVAAMFLSPVAAQQQVAVIGDFPGCQEIALDPPSNRLYATVGGALGLAVIDTAARSFVTAVPAGGAPWNVAFNPLTKRIYVANQIGGGITVIDAVTNTVRTTIDPWRHVAGVAVDMRTNRVYATEELGTSLLIVDGVAEATIGIVTLPVYRPASLVLNPATNRLYITNTSGGPVVVVDVTTNAVVNTIPAALGNHIALDLVNQRIYVTEEYVQQLLVIDLATETAASHFIDSAPLASDPIVGVGYNGHTNHIFVSRALSHSVVVLDAATFSVLATIPSGNFGIAVNEADDTVYVCERGQAVDGDPPMPGRLHILSDASVLTVSIDVRPETIQLRANGTVSAAIFSSASFDATQVDPSTVRLAGAPAVRSSIEDVDGDGRPDIVVHVLRSLLQLTPADTEATLTGTTTSGRKIVGRDTVRVIR